MPRISTANAPAAEAVNADSSTPSPVVEAAAPAAAIALPKDDAAAKAEALRKEGADAVQALSGHFGAERWSRVIQRAERAGMRSDEIPLLAAKMIRTRKAHHPKNEKAALLGAANGFLCAVGLCPTGDEVKAFETALAATAV